MMQRRVGRRILVLLATAFALGTGVQIAEPAGAAASPAIQATLNADGSGALLINPTTESWSWEACTPHLSECTPFATGWQITTAGAAPETVFRASSGGGAAALSPVWHGNVASHAPPSVNGIVRANELVTPIPGEWSGGWDGDFDLTQLSACGSPAGTDCTTLTDPIYPAGCRHGATVLDPAFTGAYLRVADERFGVGTAFTLEADASPYGHEVWVPGPRTSVAIVGRIAPAAGPRTAKCGPPPLVEASISRRGIATVHCGLGCSAVLVARRGTLTVRLARKLPPMGTRTRKRLWLSRRSLSRLGLGPVRIILKIDGKRSARRTMLLG